MSEGDKIFWDHLYILYLVTQTYPRFIINIYPTKVVDQEDFDAKNFKTPKYFTFARNKLQRFFSDYQLKKVFIVMR